jgi:hypothetical protein
MISTWPVAAHVAVAAKGRQHVLMPEILRPGLVLLGRFAFLPRKQRQRLPKAVRVEVRQASRGEGLPEDGPDRSGTTPVPAIQAHCPEPKIVADRDLRCREQLSVRPPGFGKVRNSPRRSTTRYERRFGSLAR